MQLVTRKLKLIAMAFCLLVSLLPMQPSAVALPNSQPVGASGAASRVVPIFNSTNSQQAVMTGYLYSSRLVFAIAPLSGSPDFYVGLPKSLASKSPILLEYRVDVDSVSVSTKDSTTSSVIKFIGCFKFRFHRACIL